MQETIRGSLPAAPTVALPSVTPSTAVPPTAAADGGSDDTATSSSATTTEESAEPKVGAPVQESGRKVI